RSKRACWAERAGLPGAAAEAGTSGRPGSAGVERSAQAAAPRTTATVAARDANGDMGASLGLGPLRALRQGCGGPKVGQAERDARTGIPRARVGKTRASGVIARPGGPKRSLR